MVWRECDKRTQGDDDGADPDPDDKRIEKRLDDRQTAVLILTLIDYVEVPQRSGVVCNDGLHILAGPVKPRLWLHLKLFFTASGDIDQSALGNIVVVGLLCETAGDQMVGTNVHALANIKFLSRPCG